MSGGSFMDKLRSFLGIRQETPRNDFRNPIWGSDDEDDGDEFYSRHDMDIYQDSKDLQQEFARQMQDMLRSFGSIFGDIKIFHDIDPFPAIEDRQSNSENYTGSSIRDYYLKPGYNSAKIEHPKEDIDLDGKVSSHEISSLLKQKKGDHGQNSSKSVTPFDGNLVPGRSFCQTIITTSVTKPDGTVETRRIIKNGNEVIEETTTSTAPNLKGPLGPTIDAINSTSMIYNNVMTELSSLFKNIY